MNHHNFPADWVYRGPDKDLRGVKYRLMELTETGECLAITHDTLAGFSKEVWNNGSKFKQVSWRGLTTDFQRQFVPAA